MTLAHCVVMNSSRSLMLLAISALILMASSCDSSRRDEPEVHRGTDSETRLHQRPYRNGPEE